MGRLQKGYRSGVAKAVPAWRTCSERIRVHGLPGSMAAPADGSRRSSGRRAARCGVRIVPRFADVLAAPEQPAIVAVDMPIGLPERVGAGGRAAENCGAAAARRPPVVGVLGAVARRDLCRRLRRGLPRRAGYLGAAAQGVEAALQHRCRKSARWTRRCAPAADAAARVFEVHPELAFWRLNGERALGEPKKVKSRPYEPGLALRRGLLMAAGLAGECRERHAAQGAAADDLLDALACAAIARRIHAGARAAVPRSAAARRVRVADGDLGMRFARNRP